MRFRLSCLFVVVAVIGVSAFFFMQFRNKEKHWEDALTSIIEAGGSFYPDKRPFHTDICVTLSGREVSADLSEKLTWASDDIVSLDLSDSSVGKPSVDYIVRLHRLEELDLRGTSLGADDAKKIAQSISGCKVRMEK